MSDQEVIYEVKNFVATITINRPKTLNAFTGDTIKEMERLLAQAGNDPKVGVIVLTGAGKAFSGGADIKEFGKPTAMQEPNLNSVIGVLLIHEMPPNLRSVLTDIQHELFDLGGELSIPGQTTISDSHKSFTSRINFSKFCITS